MRITRKRFINILLSIFAVSFVVVGVMVLIFTTIGGKKDNKQDNVVELAYSYSSNKTYVVSSPASYSLNTSDKTAKFTGLTSADYSENLVRVEM